MYDNKVKWLSFLLAAKLNSFLEKCRFMSDFLWIIAEKGVFLCWKNAERHIGKKNTHYIENITLLYQAYMYVRQ